MELNNLRNNKHTAIQKSGKYYSVVLFDKDKHLVVMAKILSKNAKFEVLQFDHDKGLNYVLNLKKKVINVLNDLNNKEEITEVDYNHPYPCSSRPGKLYGVAINTPPYQRVKFLVSLLIPLTSSYYTIKTRFHLGKKCLLLIEHIT